MLKHATESTTFSRNKIFNFNSTKGKTLRLKINTILYIVSHRKEILLQCYIT